MSFAGGFTPLTLNVVSGFMQYTGLMISAEAQAYQGLWNASGYTYGSLVADTGLGDLVQTIENAYGVISDSAFEQLTTIGSNSIPALGNSKPAEFIPTYAGNTNPYPPNDYPNPSSTYGWLAGWSEFSPYTYYSVTSLSDAYWKHGFIALIAQQAHYEIFNGNGYRQYYMFSRAWQQHLGFVQSQNQTIASVNNSQSMLLGNFSNINDLTTSDISGVSLAFREFGTDLINFGRFFELRNMYRFGTPSVTFLTMQKYNALTDAVRLAMLYSGLSTQDINNIFSATYIPSPEQESKLYQAMLLIQGNDLRDVLIIMNCQTLGLNSLADVVNPKLIFPNSYQTLTVPKYSLNTVSSKIYDLIYVNGGVNTTIKNWGTYLDGIIPDKDIIIACGAFSMAMQQIKNVVNMDPLKLAQVVYELEVVDKGLPLINSTQGIPGNQEYLTEAASKIAFGSGPGGTYRMCDFFGAASGLPYVQYFRLIQPLMQQLMTPALRTIYANMRDNYSNEPALLLLIADANAEIANILSANPLAAASLNKYWSIIGKQLSIEQRAIPISTSDPGSYAESLTQNDINSFAKSIEEYGLDTTVCGAAQVLEGVSNTTILTGQSIVAAMREARNAARLALVGGVLDNDVSPVAAPADTPTSSPATAEARIVNGTLEVTVNYNGTGYDPCEPPSAMILTLPTATVNATLVPVVDESTGTITSIDVINPTAISGYEAGNPPQVYIQAPTNSKKLGVSTLAPLASSPYVDLVPNTLTTTANSSYTTSEAIVQVNRLSQGL